MDNTEQLMDKMHTPTPWSVSLGRTEGYVMAGRFCIASLGDGAQPRDANAEYIVRCVNAHDALVAALERAFMVFGRFGGNHVLHEQDPQGVTVRHEEIRAAWIDARAAISAATEQS